MRKKPKKIFVKRLVTMFILINWFSGSMSWLPTSLLYAEGEQEISSPTQEEVQSEEQEVPVDENQNGEANTTLNQTPDTQPSVDQPTEESTPAPLDLSELTNRINQLEQTLQKAIANRLDEAVIDETQHMLGSAKALMQDNQLTQEKLDEVLLQLQTQNETLIFLNKRAEIQVGTREASGDSSSDEALIGDSEREKSRVKQTIEIIKEPHPENNSIDWQVTFTAFDGTWSNPRIYLWMPKNIGVTGLEGATNTYENTRTDSSSFDQKFQQTLGGNATDNRFVYNNLERLRETGDMARLLEYRSGNLNNNQSRTYTFTTKHDSQTDLDLVVLGATIQNGGFRFVRTLIKGQLGIEKHHELQLPKDIIYVVNQANLTATEKTKVKADVMEETLAFYKRTGKAYEQSELKNLAPNNFVVSNNGYVTVTWKDGTVSKLDVQSKIVQKDLQVSPQTQEVMEQAPIQEIKITGIGPDAMIDSIEAVNLPTGLNISKNADKTYSITGTISNVTFPEGQETVSYSFNVKATDPTDGQVIEKPITITVKKNPGLVPVGTHERGYHLPLILLSLGSLATLIMWTKLRMKGDQTEW